MQALRGITWLLLLQSIGEVISRGLHLPLPGPVVGMLLLLVALRWPLVQRHEPQIDLTDLAAGGPSKETMKQLHQFAESLKSLLENRCRKLVVEGETLFERSDSPHDKSARA